MHQTAVRALAIAVVALLFTGGLALMAPRSGDDRELDVLRTAAEATREAGSARVEVSGHGESTIELKEIDELLALDVSVDDLLDGLPEMPAWPSHARRPERPDRPESSTRASGEFGASARFPELPHPPEIPEIPEPPELPELPELPAELRARLEARARIDTAPAYGQAPPSARHDARDEFARAREEMRESLEEARREVEAAIREIPRRFECRYSYAGEGVLEIPGRIEISGEGDVRCSPEAADASATFHVAIAHDGGLVAGGDGTAGPLLHAPRVPVSADDLAALLEGARGRPDDRGVEVLDDGTRVRHVHFQADPESVTHPRDEHVDPGDATTTVDVWIGVDDHLVRRAVVRTRMQADREHATVTFSSEQTIVVTDVE